eukprot:TRINITY_DN560051_c0_g1_i1.p1 TRINITY_DN560051_c0_g1~~TRINITY_DN560051_c0_g1_i1.p1  ORF type:complete len:320 (-),score=95.19 TRINITY_DN560051_c0_g1_i1:244-1203(-)
MQNENDNGKVRVLKKNNDERQINNSNESDDKIGSVEPQTMPKPQLKSPQREDTNTPIELQSLQQIKFEEHKQKQQQKQKPENDEEKQNNETEMEIEINSDKSKEQVAVTTMSISTTESQNFTPAAATTNDVTAMDIDIPITTSGIVLTTSVDDTTMVAMNDVNGANNETVKSFEKGTDFDKENKNLESQPLKSAESMKNDTMMKTEETNNNEKLENEDIQSAPDFISSDDDDISSNNNITQKDKDSVSCPASIIIEGESTMESDTENQETTNRPFASSIIESQIGSLPEEDVSKVIESKQKVSFLKKASQRQIDDGDDE